MKKFRIFFRKNENHLSSILTGRPKSLCGELGRELEVVATAEFEGHIVTLNFPSYAHVTCQKCIDVAENHFDEVEDASWRMVHKKQESAFLQEWRNSHNG